MSERSEELLGQLVELQRRQLAAQETMIENQRLTLERQRTLVRRTLPLFVGLWLLIAYGPWLVQVLLYYTHH